MFSHRDGLGLDGVEGRVEHHGYARQLEKGLDQFVVKRLLLLLHALRAGVQDSGLKNPTPEKCSVGVDSGFMPKPETLHTLGGDLR